MNDKVIYDLVDQMMPRLSEMNDYIFDHPECDGHEVETTRILCEYLEENGFVCEKNIAGLPTAFKGVYHHGEGGPNFGLLIDLDALPGIGHACAHHMQGPAICGAAVVMKELAEQFGKPFTVTVYGTPAEETFGGKINMINAGYIKECDVALMFHGSNTTTADIKSMALSPFVIRYHGIASHAATFPHIGRSALDALLLCFNGVEHMREHVLDTCRMHYTVTNGGGADNVIPSFAEGTIALRAYNSAYLDEMEERFKDIVKGAALMTGTEYELIPLPRFEAKIPVLRLNQLLLDKAADINAPRISAPRERTGSTDFGNVMYHVPGSCIRVTITKSATAPSHSQEYLDAGKGAPANTAVSVAAKVLAASMKEMLEKPELLQEIKDEFHAAKANLHEIAY